MVAPKAENWNITTPEFIEHVNKTMLFKKSGVAVKLECAAGNFWLIPGATDKHLLPDEDPAFVPEEFVWFCFWDFEKAEGIEWLKKILMLKKAVPSVRLLRHSFRPDLAKINDVVFKDSVFVKEFLALNNN